MKEGRLVVHSVGKVHQAASLSPPPPLAGEASRQPALLPSDEQVSGAGGRQAAGSEPARTTEGAAPPKPRN